MSYLSMEILRVLLHSKLLNKCMDKQATPVPLLGAQSLTPVTQGTLGLEVVLVEAVSQVVCGQEVLQFVPVSHS